MKKLSKAGITVLVISMISVLCGCSKTENHYAWALGTSSPEDTVTQVYSEKFAQEVMERSNGSMEIAVYPNGVIGGDRELLESCADGDIPFVVQNTAPQVSFMPETAVFDLPCASTTIEEVREKIDNPEFYTAIQKVYEKSSYQLLGIADQGFRVMTTNKNIQDISGFKGQKIRTMENANHLKFWQDLGANPSPMAFSEVYIGLQQHTIDAEENPYEVIVSGKLYEQQKYMVETNHVPHLITLIASEDFMDKLSREQQKIIQEAAKSATEYAREQANIRVEDRIEIMEAAGVERIELSNEVHDEMQKLAQNVYDDIREQAGDQLVDLYIEE